MIVFSKVCWKRFFFSGSSTFDGFCLTNWTCALTLNVLVLQKSAVATPPMTNCDDAISIFHVTAPNVG